MKWTKNSKLETKKNVLFLVTLRMIMVIMQNHQRILIKGVAVSLTHFVLDVAMETTGKDG